MPWVLLLKKEKKTKQPCSGAGGKLISGMGIAAFVSREQQTYIFFMTVMGKIYIISSADPLLGLPLVARKCYI